MLHSREQVIARAEREFEALDVLVSGLSDEQWGLPLPRSETKDPWTIKDAVAHVAYWKEDTTRKARRQRVPEELRGLNVNDQNRLIFERWRDRPAADVLAYHREVHAGLVAALREAPEKWFNGRERADQWPFDIDGHVVEHRTRDIERALGANTKG